MAGYLFVVLFELSLTIKMHFRQAASWKASAFYFKSMSIFMQRLVVYFTVSTQKFSPKVTHEMIRQQKDLHLKSFRGLISQFLFQALL